MKAAFVTGGGGYVGSRLCRELTGKGCLVTAYDLHFLNEGSTSTGVCYVVVGANESSSEPSASIVNVCSGQAFLIEIIHAVVGRYVYNFQPLLTRAEVFKTGVTHYFSLDKARAHFGYSPEPRDLAGVVDWFRERGRGHQIQSTTHLHQVTAGACRGVQQTCTDTAGGYRLWVVVVLGCTTVLALVASHLYVM